MSLSYGPETDSEDELPPGWEERATIQGDVYYANHTLATTQWTHPRTGRRKKVSDKLPFGWERQILDNNKVVYIDHHNQRTTFTDPRLAFTTEKVDVHNQQFRQRFDGSTKALQVIHGMDLSDKVAVVTGANSGVGFQTARTLAFHGCRVVFACRNEGRATAAMNAILKDRPAARLTFVHLDLTSFRSVQQFSRHLALHTTVIDFLVLNAGVFGLGFTRTEDGFETMMQVNYLSHFYLVQLLLRPLLASLEPRIAILTSESHRFSKLRPETISELCFQPSPSSFVSIQQERSFLDEKNLDVLQGTQNPSPLYNDSKLFCLLLAQAIHSRYRHLGLKCNAVHPGNMVSTGLPNSWWLYRLLFIMARPFTKSTEQAAASVIFSLCSPDLASIPVFTYVNNCFPTRPADIVLQPVNWSTANGDVGSSPQRLAHQILWDVTVEVLSRTIGSSFSVME